MKGSAVSLNVYIILPKHLWYSVSAFVYATRKGLA